MKHYVNKSVHASIPWEVREEQFIELIITSEIDFSSSKEGETFVWSFIDCMNTHTGKAN